MKRNILNEVNRMREIMGLKLILEQSDESWKSVAKGKPYKLIFDTSIKGDDFYFASTPTIKFLSEWPSEDILLDFKSISKYRIPKNVLLNYKGNPNDRINRFLEIEKNSKPRLSDDNYFYLGNLGDQLVRWPSNIEESIEKNPDFSKQKILLCNGNRIWEFLEDKINNGQSWTMNEIREHQPGKDYKKTGIIQKGTNLFGQFIPGCTDEIKSKFMEYIDNWIQSNANGNYSKNTLYGKIKKNGIILGLDKAAVESSSSPEEEDSEGENNNALSITPKITGIDGEPFVNNSFELSESTLSVIEEIKQAIQQVLQDNPGVYAVASDKLDINGKKTNIPYTISTSSSRLTNGGQAKEWTFLELSEKRAKRAAQVMSQTIGPLLQGGLPNPVLNFKGGNGDGSSGPNPTSPNSVSTDGKESTRYQNGSEDANNHRNDYGSAKPKEQLEEYKYCIINLGIKFVYSEEDESPGDDNSTYPDEVTIGDWLFTIVPGDRPKRGSSTRRRKKVKIRIPTGGGGGGGHIMPCVAYD